MNANLREAIAVLPEYLSQHVLLSIAALALGVAISLPLAVVAARMRMLRGAVLGFAGLIQTIPALALLALFYPILLALSLLSESVFGFGFRALGFLPALLALTLYSMLPVLRNTITALIGIDPAIRMAAQGVGMTPRQSLWLVELPLAAPVIMAGIRTATVWVIGAATLSTPIGQTSLGNYIFTGLQTENWVFVLFGCVAAGAAALVADRFLALAEDGIARRSSLRLWLAGLGLAAVLLASLLPGLGKPQAGLVIGAKNFGEQYILSALIGQRLQAIGVSSTVKADLGSAIAFHALAAGDVDLYVDYSGTLWGNQMHRGDMPGRGQMLAQMSKWMHDTNGITLLGPLGFENAYSFAMRRDRAEALHINTLADVASVSRRLKMGGDFEIFTRPEWRAVTRAYGLGFAAQRQYQPNFLYRAVTSGDVDVISAFSSDGRVAQYDLKILADPKGALPPYDAVLLLGPAHAHDAALIAALKPLTGAISLSLMQQANLMVDRDKDKQTPAQAARWLATRLMH
ncbi:MAG TPA: ABC transporter permease/substrate-binding protein [Rhizomicrobium sp.]|nr:ABC transporter permease/substrate-binding protein [Rhizomicrobium sp.]